MSCGDKRLDGLALAVGAGRSRAENGVTQAFRRREARLAGGLELARGVDIGRERTDYREGKIG